MTHVHLKKKVGGVQQRTQVRKNKEGGIGGGCCCCCYVSFFFPSLFFTTKIFLCQGKRWWRKSRLDRKLVGFFLLYCVVVEVTQSGRKENAARPAEAPVWRARDKLSHTLRGGFLRRRRISLTLRLLSSPLIKDPPQQKEKRWRRSSPCCCCSWTPISHAPSRLKK